MMNFSRQYRMRLIMPVLAFFGLAVAMSSCNDDDDNIWDRYETWRNANTSYFSEQQYKIVDGLNYYSTLTPVWNTSAQVLIRYLNDRTLTEGNLSPLLTSTVDVKYKGWLYNGAPFDSSYNLKTNGDSIFRTSVNSVIDGWTIALQDMRVGDSAEIVIPYNLGYGAQNVGNIPPYSTLIFNVKLVDIPYYEVRP